MARQVVAQAADLYSGGVGRSLRSELGADATSDFQVYEAILRFHQYLHELSDESYAAARQALERAIHIEPGNPLLLSKLGDARRAGYCLGFTDEPDPSDEVLAMQQRAVALDPGCLPCRVSLGFALLKQRQHRALRDLIEANLKDTTAPPSHRTDMAMLCALSGDWERGCKLLTQELCEMPGHPAQFEIPLVLDAYRRGDYSRALELSNECKPTPLFWLPMVRAACHGRLGDHRSAQEQLTLLLALRPGFPSRGRRYLSCFLTQDDLVDDLLDGLRLGGLDTG